MSLRLNISVRKSQRIAEVRGNPSFWPEHDLRCEAENFSVNGGANHGRDIFVLCDKGSGYYDVKTGLCATLGNTLACAIDFSAPHEGVRSGSA